MTPSSIPPNMRSFRRASICWSVVEEHLEEAAFLWGQWEQTLSSPEYVLAEVVGGPERRLLAHLEGLSIAGEPAARRLLLPAIEGGEADRVVPAAYALLGCRADSCIMALWEMLADSAKLVGRDILRAVGLSPRKDIEPGLLRLLPRLDPDLWPWALEALGLRGVDTAPVLAGLRQGGAPALLAAGLRAARFTERSLAVTLVKWALRDSCPAVRDAALFTGLTLGFRGAWQRSQQVVRDREPEGRLAMLSLAISGEGSHTEVLIKALRAPEQQRDAAWALGFSGQLAAADALLELLREGGGWLVADAFAAITGMPLEVGAPEEQEDEREECAPLVKEGAAALLPWPISPSRRWQVEAVEDWWHEARSRFEPGRRYLQGCPWTVESAYAAFTQAPMHRRHVLGWELSIRTLGVLHIETRGWAHQQRKQLAAAHPLLPKALSGPFSHFITR